MPKQRRKIFFTFLAGIILVAGVLLGYAVWRFIRTPVAQTPFSSSLVHVSKNLPSDNAPQASDSSLALFAQQLVPGHALSDKLVVDGEVALATTIAKTGEAALRGKGLSDGLFLYLNKVNTEYGGLGKKFPISLDQRDDGGQLLSTVRHIGELLPMHSVFFSPMGDIAFEKAFMPLVQAQKAAVFFPITGLRPITEFAAPLMFFRPSYEQEVAALVHYATTVLKKSKVAVFYEESLWGRAGKQAVERLLAGNNMTLAGSASYQPGTVNIEAALRVMQQVEPHVIICIANGRPAYNFIREAVNKRLHYVSFLGTSQLAGIAQHLQESRGITMVTSSVVPNPHNSQLAVTEEYRQDMQQYLPNKGLSTYSLEGYINSMLLTYFLQQLPSTATVSDLQQLMRHTQNLEFKGLHLSCLHDTLSHTVWINEGRTSTWHEFVVRQS